MEEIRLTNYDDFAAAIDRGDTVYMHNAGPMGNKKIRVLDYMVSSAAYPDDEWLDEEGFESAEEWHREYRGHKAVVAAEPMGQGGTNTRILDSVDIEDFDLYYVPSRVRENRKMRSSKNVRENRRRSNRKSLKEMRKDFNPERIFDVFALKNAILDKNPNFTVDPELVEDGFLANVAGGFNFSWKGEMCGAAMVTMFGYEMSGLDERYYYQGSTLEEFDQDLDLIVQECRDRLQEYVKHDDEIFIEILEDGEWKVVGQDRNGPSTTARARAFNTEAEAKRSGLYRTLENQGYSEDNETLRLTTGEENV